MVEWLSQTTSGLARQVGLTREYPDRLVDFRNSWISKGFLGGGTCFQNGVGDWPLLGKWWTEDFRCRAFHIWTSLPLSIPWRKHHKWMIFHALGVSMPAGKSRESVGDYTSAITNSPLLTQLQKWSLSTLMAKHESLKAGRKLDNGFLRSSSRPDMKLTIRETDESLGRQEDEGQLVEELWDVNSRAISWLVCLCELLALPAHTPRGGCSSQGPVYFTSSSGRVCTLYPAYTRRYVAVKEFILGVVYFTSSSGRVCTLNPAHANW
jgi:hypothetical protein